MRYLLIAGSLFAFAACTPQIPDSGAGVGFDSYDSFQAQQDAQLSAQNDPPLEPATTIAQAPLEGADGVVPPEQVVAQRPATISDEQDFTAVADRETIESDAARIAANRELYVQIEPTDLPVRNGSSGPSIVAYALATTNQVGQPLYHRSKLFAEERFNRNCAKYTSADKAQAAFLVAGGPKRDTKGLDPDGDGFACYWDPAPFRQARLAAVTPSQ